MNIQSDNNNYRTLLWVEDDVLFVKPYAGALRDAGFTVLTAPGIRQAISMLKKHTGIGVIILDVMLPVTREEQKRYALDCNGGTRAGVELGRWIRDNYPGKKLFGFSHRVDEKMADWFNSYGIGFVYKQAFPDERDFVRYLLQKLEGVENAMPIRTFIVHGYDEIVKLELKNYLQNRLGLPEPVILHEQPAFGRTLLEKFEQEARMVDVVFVLLTPDDTLAPAPKQHQPQRRARQNVIFELGYFLAKLERSGGRVILLYKGKIELPSDIAGLVYINIDHGIEAAGEQIRNELKNITRGP